MKHLEAKSVVGLMQPSEIMFVGADTVSVLSLFTAQRANQVLRLYPEQILLLCWLTEKQAQVQINVVFFSCLFLNLVWSVLCSGMHPASCQMGESCSLFHPDQRYCWWWKKENVQETQTFQRLGPISKERRKFFRPKKSRQLWQRIKQQSVL